MISLNENELLSRTTCNWRPGPPQDALLETCASTLEWALGERYQGSVPPVTAIRAQFVRLWQKSWGDRAQIGQDYWQGPRTAIGFGTRLYKLLLHYNCLLPLETHTVTVGSDSITCRSALLEQPKGRYHPQRAFALDTRTMFPKILYLPDYRGLARWLAMQTERSDEIGLLHFPLLRGKPWAETYLDRNLVETWLQSILKQAETLPAYPVAGPYCRECSAPCREVFHGPNDYFRKGRLAQVSGI